MAEMSPEYAKKRDQFSKFLMPDGSTHRIRNKYLLDFAVEAFRNEPPLSKGALIIRDCVACSPEAGKLTELLSMLGDK